MQRRALRALITCSDSAWKSYARTVRQSYARTVRQSYARTVNAAFLALSASGFEEITKGNLFVDRGKKPLPTVCDEGSSEPSRCFSDNWKWPKTTELKESDFKQR